MRNIFMVIIIFTSFSLSSCGTESAYYQKQVGIPETLWYADNQPEFSVELNDSSFNYNLFLLIRHDEAYPYANLWYNLKIKKPGDSVYSQEVRLETTLADSDGKWLGLGINDITEHKLPIRIADSVLFDQTGLYHFKIEQAMRTNPLPSILNVGLIIESRP